MAKPLTTTSTSPGKVDVVPHTITHATCPDCWPDPLAPGVLGLCGAPAVGPANAAHLCGWRGAGCGCQPCLVCVDLEPAPCSGRNV